MKKYKHIFFDLDHTLWDFERNSAETLGELYEEFKLATLGNFSSTDFIREFRKINYELWNLYSKGLIDKNAIRHQRFQLVFTALHIPIPSFVFFLQETYIKKCPLKPHLLPYASVLLTYLKPHYQLHIITNGFDDIQKIKLKSSGIDSYFQEIITSDTTGYKKPSREIFEFAVDKVKANKEECLMIGDDLEADVLGAIHFGMDAVFYNPQALPNNFLYPIIKYEIRCLSFLLNNIL